VIIPARCPVQPQRLLGRALRTEACVWCNTPDVGAWQSNLDRRQLLLVLATGTAAALSGCATGTASGTADARGTQAAVAPRTRAGSRLYPTGPRRPLPPIPPAHAGPAQVVDQLPPGSRRVALTIDDGYDRPTVAAYVRFAADTGIPITFNPNGCYAPLWEPHASTLRPLIEAGQVQIGNHTFDHKDLRQLSGAQIRAQVERNDDWVQRTFGTTTRPWFRPPFGFHTARTDAAVGAAGYTKILLWNGSFGDSRLLTRQVLLEQASLYLKPGVIMLGHANHRTVTGLYRQITDLIRRRDLQPATLDTVFGTSRVRG
jgi:peptidoglycan-N-acetylglucosamine deacetylase